MRTAAASVIWAIWRPVRRRRSLGRLLAARGSARFPRPVVGSGFGLGERLRRLEARGHGCRGAHHHLMMLDVEGPEPPLLTHRDGDEIAELDELRLGEMPMQPLPQRVVR